jgi:RNA polymerase sigma-70 factor (ECF subfamily)
MTPDASLLHEAPPSALGVAEPTLDRERAATIFADHCDYVWNALKRLGILHSDLEDLTHDTFVAVFRQWHGYDAERPLRPWLFGFALRIASDHRRRARHRFEFGADSVEACDEAPGAVDLMLQKERAALAHSAMQAVELDRRAVFILHELDGVTLPEIATALAIPLGTASSRLRLAREDFVAAVKRLSLRAR